MPLVACCTLFPAFSGMSADIFVLASVPVRTPPLFTHSLLRLSVVKLLDLDSEVPENITPSHCTIRCESTREQRAGALLR